MIQLHRDPSLDVLDNSKSNYYILTDEEKIISKLKSLTYDQTVTHKLGNRVCIDKQINNIWCVYIWSMRTYTTYDVEDMQNRALQQGVLMFKKGKHFRFMHEDQDILGVYGLWFKEKYMP